MIVRISNEYWSSNWNLLELLVLDWVHWVRVLIDHPSIALAGHFHLLILIVSLMVNDWLHLHWSLHLVLQLSESVNFSVVLIDLLFNRCLK
jgi:hypothetical protein